MGDTPPPHGGAPLTVPLPVDAGTETAIPPPEQPGPRVEAVPPTGQLDRPRAAGDSWLAVILVLLTFAGVIGGMLAAWWRVGPHPPTALERYFPHADGTTLSYHVRGVSGPQLYQSSSTVLLEGTEAGSQLPARLLTRALALSAGGAPTDDDEAMIERAQQAEANLLRVTRITGSTYQTSGAITHTVGLYLVLPERIGLIMIDDTPIDPPLPILDMTMKVGHEQASSGTFGTSLPYTSTLTLETREAVDTPAGRLDDCLRTRLELEVGTYDALLVSWFCDGVGLARQEARWLGETETRRYELIGGSTPGLLLKSATFPPLLAPDRSARPRGLGGSGELPDLPAGELATLWHYQQPGANMDVTAAPLPVGELLIVGTANGSLIAIDRASHEQRWSFQAGGAIVGTPVVEGGVLFFGANDRKLYALDLLSGAFRWAFAARDAISASPEVAGDTVYVGSEDRSVYALNVVNGQERWRFTAGDAVITTPQLAASTLFVGADDGVLYALDARSGAPRWAFSAEDAITSSPLVRNGVVYVGSHDGRLYALRAESASQEGDLLWSYDAEDAIAANIALADETIYLTTVGGSLRAVDARSGAERWRAGDGIAFDGAPLVAGEQILIGRDLEILAFAARDGRTLAPIPLGTALNSYGITASISGDDGELFVGRANGIVQVIGPAEGQLWVSRPVWKAEELTAHLRQSGEIMVTPPVLMGERLVGVTYGGLIYSVSLADGSFRDHGRLSSESAFVIPTAADTGMFYAIDGAGTLYAFDLEEGGERWRVELEGFTRSAPALLDGRVLVATSGDAGTVAYAFDARSSEQIWRQRFEPSPTGAAYTLLHNGRFFVTAGALQTLDPASGETLWSSDESLIAVQLAAAGDTIYSLANDGQQWRLASWEAATGARRLSVPVAAPTFPNLAGGISAGDGEVALLLNDRTLLALDAESGAERWRLRLGSGTRGAPVIYGGQVLVQTQRNHLLAHALNDGRLDGDFALLDDTGSIDFSAVSPLVHDGRIYVAFYQGFVALNLRMESR